MRRLLGSRATSDLLAVVVAWNFAVAQPILDLLGRNSAFFVAHGTEPVDVVTFAVGLCLVLPLLLGGALGLVARLSGPVGRALHTAVLAVLVGLVPYQVLKRLGATSVGLWAAFAVAAGLGAAIAYRRSDTARAVVRWLSPAPLVFLGVFLLASPARGIVWPSRAAAPGGSVGNPVPVVMVVFDGFPAVSLLASDGRLDTVSYPNFARLAATSTWYRNTTTISDKTVTSVPAILDGRFPDPSALPTVADHPDNLFALLASDYRIEAYESMTSLCPSEACGSIGGGLSFWARARALWDDTRVVAGHVVLPPGLADGLPPIDRSWGDFGTAGQPAEPSPAGGDWSTRVMRAARHASSPGAAVRKRMATTDPAGAVRSFAAGFGRHTARPALHFLHLQLPHTPWRFLPDGRTYDDDGPYPEPRDGEWWPARTLADQGRVRHLLQAGYADRLLGEVLDGLDRTGLSERALVIVTADHGAAFEVRYPRRTTRAPTAGDIAWVPLFVKEPHQTSGRVDDRPAATLDIAPTVAAVLDVRLRAPAGRSLTMAAEPGRRRLIVLPDLSRLPLSPEGTELAGALRRKGAVVGTDPTDPHRLFRLGPAGVLVGTRVPSVSRTSSTPGLRARLNERERFDALDPDAPRLPVVVGGTVSGPGGGDRTLVVAVNRVVAGTALVYARDGERASFTALLDPSTFRRGANRIELYAVDGPPHARSFARIPLS